MKHDNYSDVTLQYGVVLSPQQKCCTFIIQYVYLSRLGIGTIWADISTMGNCVVVISHPGVGARERVELSAGDY